MVAGCQRLLLVRGKWLERLVPRVVQVATLGAPRVQHPSGRVQRVAPKEIVITRGHTRNARQALPPICGVCRLAPDIAGLCSEAIHRAC